MPDGLLALRGAEQAAGAAVVGLALLAHHSAAADGACGWHVKVRHIRAARPGLRSRIGTGHQGNAAYHFGNHIARAAHDHLVAHAHALLADVKHIRQGGIGDGDAAHKHRCQARHRRELAGTAHLDVNALQARHHLLRRVFVRDGPARLAAHKTQLALLRPAVDLVDHAIDLVAQAAPLCAHALVKGDQLARSTCQTDLWRHRKTPGLDLHQHGVVALPVRPTAARRGDLAHTIGKE
ncbi:hypothetical protein D3C72_1131100 [compost metagenome]